MNSSFNIFTPGVDFSHCSLLIEIGNQGISYIIINEENACTALAVYHFVAGTTIGQLVINLKTIVEDQAILQQPFKKINIIYTFEKALLIPHQYMNLPANKTMLELVYGDTSDDMILTDFIFKYNIHTAYLIPKQVDAALSNLFLNANYTHQYSILPNVVEATGNLLYCIFTTNNITVQLFKLGKLQIIQNFYYKLPEDASYNLLNICAQFEVSVNDTVVYFNGMINEGSSLSAELYNYFPHPTFADLPKNFTYNEEFAKYPEHYFSHLFQLAACV